MKKVQSISEPNNQLIGQYESLAILGAIFYDAFLLDFNFTIRSVGQSVLADLGYEVNALAGKPIDAVIPDFKNEVLPLLRHGYFLNKHLSLNSRWNDTVLVSLSGFYTGLLTDVNGYIILRYENLDEIKRVKQKLDAKTDEMDHFVYQASHSLRGPLATIKGLINIAKVEQDPGQLEFIHQQMEDFANRLDTKLYKLMCFAEANRAKEIPNGKINAGRLKNKLTELSDGHQEAVVFECQIKEMEGLPVNEHLVESLIANVTSFILIADRQPKSIIEIAVTGGYKVIEIVFLTIGFHFDLSLKDILVGNHGYGHLLEQPDLTNIYSAKKLIFKLQGKISFQMEAGLQATIRVALPYNFISLGRS